MHLADVPLLFILAGLIAYAVLAGADFGAGFWQLLGGGGERGRRIREYAHHAMGPVWEANHVWLIFVLVICWTGYPTVFGSITSTLAVPLFIAGIGIILRGTAYALRSGTESIREQRRVEMLFAASSILTPFALGTVIGGIASGRVPVGNAAGDEWTSWLNATSIAVGVLAVATAAYLAAVYLAADASREGERELVEAFRTRALGAAVVAGAAALAGLVALRFDRRELFDDLMSGWALGAVLVSAVAGLATLALIVRRRFELARATAALAVAAVVVGWALAQRPELLPGLTIDEAAAPRSTLIAIIVSVAGGAVLLVPSLAFLFGLVLRGRFDHGAEEPPEHRDEPLPAGAPSRLAVAAAACAVLGAGLAVIVDRRWALIAGILLLFVFIVAGFVSIAVSAVEEPATTPPPR